MTRDDVDREEGAPEHLAPRVYPAGQEPPGVGAAERRARRQALIERHLGLARHLALRYRDRGVPIEDLVQVASLGLLKAADRFDPERGREP